MQLLITKADKPPHYKGDIVEIRASGASFSGDRELAGFVLVEVPGVPMADYRQYNCKWERLIEFEVVAQDASQDGYRLRMFAATVNGALGAITRADAETFIESWGGTVHSFGPNEVVFDVRIYDALTSPAFWGLDADFDISGIEFSEISYDEGTGIHRIEADYSALGNNPSYVEMHVAKNGLVAVSHDNQVLVYDADRSVAREVFEADLADKTKRKVARRRYHVSAAVVDYIVGQGGRVSTDLSTLAGYIRDKATE